MANEEKIREEIKTKIVGRLGFFPPFFAAAESNPEVLRQLWSQTEYAYLDNPWPAKFKEKLAALIARYCSARYCLMVHSAALKPMGLTASEIFELLQIPPLSASELQKLASELQVDALAIGAWPQDGSNVETYLLQFAVTLFLNQDAELDIQVLRNFVGDTKFDHLICFISYNRMCLNWVESHPEISAVEDDRVKQNYPAIAAEAPRLAQFFSDYEQTVKRQTESRERRLRADLRASQEWFETTLDSIGDAVVAVDNGGVITYLNEVAERILQIELHEVQGKLLEQVLDTEEGVLTRSDGSEVFVEFNAAPIANGRGEVLGSVVVFRDVSQQVIEEQKLTQTLLELQAEKKNRESFIATLTHDLRNPLTVAKMSAQLLLKAADQNEFSLRAADRIVKSVTKADEMIQELLDADRLRSENL